MECGRKIVVWSSLKSALSHLGNNRVLAINSGQPVEVFLREVNDCDLHFLKRRQRCQGLRCGMSGITMGIWEQRGVNGQWFGVHK